MFDRILDVIAKVWEQLLPWEIVNCYQSGVVLRLGCYHRTVQPGLAWKIPFIEDLVAVSCVLTTLRLPPQTLTTSDGFSVVVAVIVKYKIDDPKPYVTEIWDQGDVLADVTMGMVRERVQKTPWKNSLADDLPNDITISVRRAVKRFGFSIESITFTDFGRVRSLRLIQQPAVNLDN
jgi:regulator of protease activity HflC (stomatin/prohibitin superfamily)